MEIVEIRDLDGPNLFALRPAIKLELRLADGEQLAATARYLTGMLLGCEPPPEPLDALTTVVQTLHRRLDLPVPPVGRRALDEPGHQALHYPWEWRQAALGIAEASGELLTGGRDDPLPRLREALGQDRARGDRPEWVTDAERRVPTAAVTGTNGKTTTTRLLAHIGRQAGKRVGWSSSTGVYIQGEEVLAGDYTGVEGARRVLLDPAVELGVLESARGGILRRGLAYQSNDVGVFLNISADHLGMQGVQTLETLAEVKSTVVRVTRPEGLVVLNADDSRVLACREQVRAAVLLFSRQPAHSSVVAAHLAEGGQAIVRQGDQLLLARGDERLPLLALNAAPVTFGGAAAPMVENVMAAAGAALGLGFNPAQIAAGVATFRPDRRGNPGRLNVYRLDDRVVVIDYAHNERGLELLLDFAEHLRRPSGALAAIIGTAGDRQDEVYRGLARIAGSRADRVYLKENPNYLRGREPGSATEVMRAGLAETRASGKLAGAAPGEFEAVTAALADSRPGDVIAVMCVEDQQEILEELERRGAEPL